MLKELVELNEIGEGLRFISLCSDTTFKYLYKNEKTRKWFNYLIKEKFNLDLNDYILVDNELNTGNDIKDYRLDLKLEKGNNIVIIEMNQTYYNFLDNKNYQYLYRIAGSRYDSGEEYITKPTKLVLFNYFKNKKIPEMKLANYVLEEVETKLRINDIESYEIYLPNYKKVCYDSSEVDISLSLFSCDSYESMRGITNNPKDIEIIEELEKLAMNEKFIYEYDREAVQRKTENSIRSEGKEEGRREGKKEGISERNIEIAKAMLIKKMDISLISELTGLSKEKIENLK